MYLGTLHTHVYVLELTAMVALLQNTVSAKQRKKRFLEAICRMFVAELKPFYQAGRFKSIVSIMPG